MLNKLINPHWPYVPDRPDGTADKEEIDKALESVPDDPMKYDFKYHILEADENGRRPKIKVKDKSDPMKTKWTKNTKFNHQSMSCLQLIADSKNKVYECLKLNLKSLSMLGMCRLKKRTYNARSKKRKNLLRS